VVSGGTAHGAGSSTGLIESARFYKVPAYLFEWWPSDEPGIVIAQDNDVEAVFVEYPARVELTDRIFFRGSLFTDWLSE